jgi:hypothetical protein
MGGTLGCYTPTRHYTHTLSAGKGTGGTCDTPGLNYPCTSLVVGERCFAKSCTGCSSADIGHLYTRPRSLELILELPGIASKELKQWLLEASNYATDLVLGLGALTAQVRNKGRDVTNTFNLIYSVLTPILLVSKTKVELCQLKFSWTHVISITPRSVVSVPAPDM